MILQQVPYKGSSNIRYFSSPAVLSINSLAFVFMLMGSAFASAQPAYLCLNTTTRPVAQHVRWYLRQGLVGMRKRLTEVGVVEFLRNLVLVEGCDIERLRAKDLKFSTIWQRYWFLTRFASDFSSNGG